MSRPPGSLETPRESKKPARICTSEKGLSVDYARGGYFGRATYLAEEAAYSESGYSHDLGNGTRQLLVVEAALGKMEARQQLDRTITSPKAGYHSVAGRVGSSTSTTAHMLYQDYQCYPSHIVTYRRA